MATFEDIELSRIINAIRRLKSSISISSKYHEQMKEVRCLLKNDSTGFVNTILDFMVNAASVPLKIETKNESLDGNLLTWQKTLLNKDINLDIPRGLRELSGEYFRERWTSSFIVLRIEWGELDFGNNDKWLMPTEMYFADGCSVYVEGDSSSLTNRKYYLGKTKKEELKDTKTSSVIIRKPYNSWYEMYPTPFLVKRGVLFNALLKQIILCKQADVLEQIIPYLLLLNSGTDKLAELGMLAEESELKKFKDTLIDAVKEHDVTGELGKLITSLSYDTKLEHFIPELKKILDADLTKGCDKNIIAGMGLIELTGFSKNREESMLNPKMLVEEVKDAVCDWALILEEIVYQIAEKNSGKYRSSINDIKVVPGKIKAFITDAYRTLITSLYNKGLIPYENTIEDIAEYDFEATLERKRKENKDGLAKDFYPPVIQNMEQFPNDPNGDLPSAQPTQPKGKQLPTTDPSTAPAKQNNKRKKADEEEDTDLEEILGELTKLTAPYNNIDELPARVKDFLPVAAQIIFVKVVNEALKRGLSDAEAFKEAWGTVKKNFHKGKDGKWVKNK